MWHRLVDTSASESGLEGRLLHTCRHSCTTRCPRGPHLKATLKFPVNT